MAHVGIEINVASEADMLNLFENDASYHVDLPGGTPLPRNRALHTEQQTLFYLIFVWWYRTLTSAAPPKSWLDRATW